MKNIETTIKDCAKTLRRNYYRLGAVQTNFDNVPFGGSIKESIGPFPEFILKGRFCKRSLKGLCSPCFYSRLPEHILTDSEYDKGYIQQVEYIVDHFKELVYDNQVGLIANNNESSKKILGLVCTPTGSYFDNNEYPIHIRKQNLLKLISAANKYNCEIMLHIESHAEDVIDYFAKADNEELILLKHLNARVILGFESYDDFSRNVIYAKDLSINKFLQAVDVLKKNCFAVGAFVFAGLFSLTDYETFIDVKKTLEFLKEHSVAPVLMFANTQPYTIPDVLLTEKKYKLVDPRTVLIIVNMMLEIFGCNLNHDIDPWFIADPMGGPPEPNHHIFNSVGKTACDECSRKIYEAVENIRITKDKVMFDKLYNEVMSCKCKIRYDKLLNENKKVIEHSDLMQRTEELAVFATNFSDIYILRNNPWVVKAQLLCYGLQLSNQQINMVKLINPYVDEKGLIHALHIKYKNTLINVCVAERFCKKSPYSAKIINSVWHLIKNGFDLGEFNFIEMPNWTKIEMFGQQIGDIARPHADKCISLWPSLDCIYIKNGNGCKFCGLLAKDKKMLSKLSKEQVVEIVSVALNAEPKYEINLSGGTCGSPNFALNYLIEICAEIKARFHNVAISVECAPSSNEKLLYKLKESGVTAIIQNIEIYNDDVRKAICPGKFSIPIETYFESLKKCVEIFGRGNVSSVLIIGLQPKEDVITACKRLHSIGVIPTLIPFKPLDGTPFEDYHIPDPTEYIEISRTSALEMKKNKSGIKYNSGCAACGACSIDIDLGDVIK